MVFSPSILNTKRYSMSHEDFIAMIIKITKEMNMTNQQVHMFKQILKTLTKEYDIVHKKT